MPEARTFELRSATPADAKTLAYIHGTARKSAMPWLPVLHTVDGDEWFYTAKVLPASDVTVAMLGPEIVGFIAQTPGWVDHLYISPAFWRQGFGAALLAQAQADQASLTLWTFAQNAAARAFYAAHGFAEVEVTDGANNEERTPDVRLVWSAGR